MYQENTNHEGLIYYRIYLQNAHCIPHLIYLFNNIADQIALPRKLKNPFMHLGVPQRIVAIQIEGLLNIIALSSSASRASS